MELNPAARRLRAILLLPLLWAAACRRVSPPSSIQISVPHLVMDLDPHAHNQLAAFAIVSQFYDTLVTTDANMQIQPCLASRWENPDPSTWIFHLRPDVRFHSGKAFSSEDVVYTLDRLLESRGLEMTGYLLYIDEVRALDPLTIRIRTTKPLAILLNKLRFISILPKGSVESEIPEHPDGTGPYRVTHWEKGKLLRLERFAGYWGRAAPVARVTFLLNRGPEEALSDILTGKSQLVQCNSKKLEASLRCLPRFQTLHRSSIFTKYLGYDLGRDVSPRCPVRPNPFRNVLVREALDIAIDRNALVRDLPYNAVPASQLVPPFIFGFDPRIRIPVHDPARTRDLLARAGLPRGFSATLQTRTLLADAARLVADQLKNVGIKFDLQVLTDPEYFARMDARDTTVHISRFGCLTGDLSDILDNVLHSLDPARHFGIHNYVGYSSPEVDAEIEASAEKQSVNARRDALQQIEDRLMRDLVWIPLFVDQDDYAVDRRFDWQPRNDGIILASEITPAS
ncbi:MAG: ABC transporter substrate-binding protein [Thermoanaerobaculia bacterium]